MLPKEIIYVPLNKYLNVYPKGNRFADNHISLYLYVANPKSLRNGWKRSADFYFLVLNQSDKVLYRSSVARNMFCAERTIWGHRKTLPLSKLREKGVLENDKLIIEVYISNVVVSMKEEIVEINGFQVLASRATVVSKLFTEHPDIAKDFNPKNQTLNKPSKNYSETELSKARSELSELMEVGFKLDWLKSKLDKVSLERLMSKFAEVSLEREKADLVQKLEERVTNLEMMDLGRLKLKLEEGPFERKKADESRIQQLEESVKNLALIVSNLKVELEKEKAKSSDDAGFLLVDEVA
ncbi:unnamed protein product [Arabis nemorensis]|uniref:MATH domain-containing protein n=1 Tax=Arabis nemorensis TaxID=586526 RepID=A0A565BNG8_9BRAS|nr:unnamed protein product [Arabis nemorensis]